MTIKANKETMIAVHYVAGQPGDFIKETPIFTDCPSQPRVVVRIVGSTEKGPQTEKTDSGSFGSTQ